MTIEDYRIRFGWSRKHMAAEAGIDVNTLRHAIAGKPVYRAKAALRRYSPRHLATPPLG